MSSSIGNGDSSINEEPKNQLSGCAATEQQLKCQLADSTAQLVEMREQLQWLQAEKEQQIAAVRREAAASQAELEALREQLGLAQQQVAQQEDDLAAATTTIATAATTTTPSAAVDVDLQLVPPPSP
ncbi:hypothetical protein VaNZ11_013790, partial [Volvox africanus]